MTYDERLKQLSRAYQEAYARYHGFVRAELGGMLAWSSRDNEQRAFDEGYVEGKALLVPETPKSEIFETAKAIVRAHVEAKELHIEQAVRDAEQVHARERAKGIGQE